MKNRNMFVFRRYWTAMGSPFKPQLRWVRHVLLARFMRTKTDRRRVSVSVVIPCHNYADVLPRAIESILKQTVIPLEILVIDDASDDTTADIAASYMSKGVSYMRVEHRNLSTTRNSAAAVTDGTFLLYLDADDYLPADYIETCLLHMYNPRVALVYGDIQYVNQRKAYLESPAFNPAFLERFNFISSNALIRRSAFDLVGGYRNIPDALEDWDFHLRVINAGYIAARANTFFYYDIHDGSLMNEHGKKQHVTYADGAAITHHPLTLFTLFTKTGSDIDAYVQRILGAGFPLQQIHLFWINACADDEFDALLRSKLASLPFGSVRYLRQVKNMGCPSDSDSETARAWNTMIAACTTNYVWFLDVDYPLPANGFRDILRLLREDLCAVFASCAACGNTAQTGEDTIHTPCFCCALVRNGALQEIRPLETGNARKPADPFALTTYRRLRWKRHILHENVFFFETHAS